MFGHVTSMVHDLKLSMMQPTVSKTTKSKIQPVMQLEQFLEEQNLCIDRTPPSVQLSIKSNEEVWIFQIPKTIDPRDLKDKSFSLKEKSSFILNGKEYEYVKKYPPKQPLPFVYKTDDGKTKMELIKPKRVVRVLRKL